MHIPVKVMGRFEHNLKGPAELPGIFTTNFSLDITTPYSCEFLFNTDTTDTLYNNAITMIITDQYGKSLITVNYLENRYIEAQKFNFIYNNIIYNGVFPKGTLGFALCSFNIIENS
jgi:hypothetical protein